MKKKIIPIIALVLILALAPQAALAHGHNAKAATVKYSLCSLSDCEITQNHRHNGKTYAGHYIGDGHDYHLICGVQDCVENCVHQHDGVVCFPHTVADGHDYHAVCCVQGCEKTVTHLHDQTICFPHTSGDGHGYHNGGNSRHH